MKMVWIVSMALGVLFVCALLMRKQNLMPNRILALLIFIQMINQTLITGHSIGINFQFKSLIGLSFPLQLLSVTLFYMYVKAFTSRQFEMRSQRLIHLVPVCFGFIYYVGFQVFGSPVIFEPGPVNDWWKYERMAITVLVGFPYLIGMIRLVKEFKLRAMQNLSSLAQLRLPVLQGLLGTYFFVYFLKIADLITGIAVPLWKWTPLVFLITLFALALYSIYYSELFKLEFAEETKNNINSEEISALQIKLLNYLESDKPFLNPQLRLVDLANSLGIKSYKLSVVINKGLKTTFLDLINGYRVEYAKKVIKDPKSQHLNLLGVAYESGFNSKSVFNEMFKKTTGMTPSQYRDQPNV